MTQIRQIYYDCELLQSSSDGITHISADKQELALVGDPNKIAPLLILNQNDYLDGSYNLPLIVPTGAEQIDLYIPHDPLLFDSSQNVFKVGPAGRSNIDTYLQKICSSKAPAVTASKPRKVAASEESNPTVSSVALQARFEAPIGEGEHTVTTKIFATLEDGKFSAKGKITQIQYSATVKVVMQKDRFEVTVLKLTKATSDISSFAQELTANFKIILPRASSREKSVSAILLPFEIQSNGEINIKTVKR